MAYAGAAVVATINASCYRVKFERDEFLRLVQQAKPKIIYQRRRMHFFAFEGFVMYSFECSDEDFSQTIFHAIEFSNVQWVE
ncbi:MAG: hypothetical protein ACW976_07540 [Candidatus Ranarchaeia archaeon]|jgi:hypothetical protein